MTEIFADGISSIAISNGVARIELVQMRKTTVGEARLVPETTATLLVPETNVGGYINTGWDLVANTVGATVAVCLIWLRGWTHDRS